MTADWGAFIACVSLGELMIDVHRGRYWWARFDAFVMAIGVAAALQGLAI